MTFFKKEDSEFDVTAICLRIAGLQFHCGCYSTQSKTCRFHGQRGLHTQVWQNHVDEKTLADFAWNDENAFSAAGNAGIRLPLYKKLSFSLAVIDNFQNDPQVGYQKNSFQFSTGLSFSLH